MMPWNEPIDISNEECTTPGAAFPKGNKIEFEESITVPEWEHGLVDANPFLWLAEVQ
jgi:hypothetical protein